MEDEELEMLIHDTTGGAPEETPIKSLEVETEAVALDPEKWAMCITTTSDSKERTHSPSTAHEVVPSAKRGTSSGVHGASAEELRTNYSFGSSCDSSENVSKSSKHLQMERVTAVAQTESSHTSNSPGKTSDDNGSEQNERSTSASSGNNDDNAVSHSFTLRTFNT